MRKLDGLVLVCGPKRIRRQFETTELRTPVVIAGAAIRVREKARHRAFFNAPCQWPSHVGGK